MGEQLLAPSYRATGSTESGCCSCLANIQGGMDSFLKVKYKCGQDVLFGLYSVAEKKALYRSLCIGVFGSAKDKRQMHPNFDQK